MFLHKGGLLVTLYLPLAFCLSIFRRRALLACTKRMKPMANARLRTLLYIDCYKDRKKVQNQRNFIAQSYLFNTVLTAIHC